jgi:hypothetical protein
MGSFAVQRQVIMIFVSLLVHLSVIGIFARRTIFPEVLEPRELVVASLSLPPPQPEARTREELKAALAGRSAPRDRSELARSVPVTEPATVALPPPVFLARGGWMHGSFDNDFFGYATRLEDELETLENSSRLPAGAMAGIVYVFDQIRQVRSEDGKWFKGRGRTQLEHRLYTYLCSFPGSRDMATRLRLENQWLGFDFTTTVTWPESRAGIYEFRLTTDAGAVFQIDGVDVIAHDGQHGFEPYESILVIEPGVHTLRLAFVQGPKARLGLILHTRKVDEGGWEIFDLRPLLMKNIATRSDPTAPKRTEPRIGEP